MHYLVHVFAPLMPGRQTRSAENILEKNVPQSIAMLQSQKQHSENAVKSTQIRLIRLDRGPLCL